MNTTPSWGVLHRTAREFEHMVQAFQERVRTDQRFSALVDVLCRTPERTRRFTAPSGCGISTFAELMELPASTVRHYQRLGLVTPYEVNRKFRFWLHNIVQVESIRQWRDLGLSLEEIRAQRTQARLGGQAATFNLISSHTASAAVPPKVFTGQASPTSLAAPISPANQMNPFTVWLPLGSERMQVSSRDAFPQGLAQMESGALDETRLRAEVQAARKRLEDRLRSLEAQLERARQLEAALGLASVDDS